MKINNNENIRLFILSNNEMKEIIFDTTIVFQTLVKQRLRNRSARKWDDSVRIQGLSTTASRPRPFLAQRKISLTLFRTFVRFVGVIDQWPRDIKFIEWGLVTSLP